MSIITTINSFKLLLEEADSMESMSNDQSQQKIDAYNLVLRNYNSNKSKFKNIFTQDKKNWEVIASKIIKTEKNPYKSDKLNNKYLSMEWEIAKLQYNLKDKTEKIKELSIANSEDTPEQKNSKKDQVAELQKDLTIIKKQISDKQQELKVEIKEDLKEIQMLQHK